MLNETSRGTAERVQIYLDTLHFRHKFVRKRTLDTLINVGSLSLGLSLGELDGGQMLLAFR